MTTPSLEHTTTLTLRHSGDCSLLGVTDDLIVYVEEVYGDEGWLAQHALALDGTLLHTVDEDFGAQTDIRPLALPDHLCKPQSGWHTMSLNFTGPRHRGLSALERLPDMVRLLSPQEKIALIKYFDLPVLPPMMTGLAESYVLAEALLVHPNLYFVCRRLRFAYLLAEEQLDSDAQPYDYDTLVVYVAHLYDKSSDQEPTLSNGMNDLPDVRLRRPMDCLICNQHLFVAEGGEGAQPSLVHVWRIHGIEPELSEDERWQKKLYG